MTSSTYDTRGSRRETIHEAKSYRKESGDGFILLLLYALGIFVGFGLYIAGFFYGALLEVPILFYRGLALIPATGIVQAILLLLGLRWVQRGRRLLWFSGANILLVVLVSGVLNFAVFVLLPVNIDRSISVFLLAWMDERQTTPSTKADLEHAFQDIYVDQYGAIDRRIAEQLASGNIEPTQNGFQLTSRGRAVVATTRFLGDLFSTDQRFLHPPLQATERSADTKPAASP
jgi:hypothetical protein